MVTNTDLQMNHWGGAPARPAPIHAMNHRAWDEVVEPPLRVDVDEARRQHEAGPTFTVTRERTWPTVTGPDGPLWRAWTDEMDALGYRPTERMNVTIREAAGAPTYWCSPQIPLIDWMLHCTREALRNSREER